jgi:CHAD domain-containing protein
VRSDNIVEREVKLEAPDAFSLARLPATFDPYVAGPVELHRLHTVYYDTGDFRLTRWGGSLRYRHGEGWTLKLPVPRESLGLFREEHAFAGTAGAIPDAALDLATAYFRGELPHRVAELRTLRATRRVFAADGTALAEVVEDAVHVVDGTHVVQRFREIEIELTKDAPDEALEALYAAVRAQGAGRPDPTPKNARALGPAALEPEIAAPHVDGRSHASDVVRATFVRSVERLVRLDAMLRLGPDADTIHQARVAVRRLRSDLRTFIPVLDRTWAWGLRDALGWLGDGLGAARDADVLLARLKRDTVTLREADRRRSPDLLRTFDESRDAAYRRVSAMLREERYVALLRDLVDAAKRPALGTGANAPAREVIPALMTDAWKKLRRAVRTRSRPPSNRELHRIRIKAKRVRYAAEAVAPAAGRRACGFARGVERLQTILGEQHDAAAAEQRLRALADQSGAAFVAGELAILERDAERAARARWRKAWRAAARPSRRFWRSA